MKRIIAAILLLMTADVFGMDHSNLEEGLPVTVEDAYATSFMNREVQFSVGWQHNEDGTDSMIYRPIVEYGVFRNASISVESEFIGGNGDSRGDGDVTFEGLYNFNTESLYWPAFGVSGHVTVPSGQDSEGVDSGVKFIMTKTICGLRRVHLNIGFDYNDEAEFDERDELWQVVAGYSAPLNNETIFVADYVWEQQLERGEEYDLVEVGLRYQLDPVTVICGGVGAGLGGDSPDVRVTLGFQRSF